MSSQGAGAARSPSTGPGPPRPDWCSCTGLGDSLWVTAGRLHGSAGPVLALASPHCASRRHLVFGFLFCISTFQAADALRGLLVADLHCSEDCVYSFIGLAAVKLSQSACVLREQLMSRQLQETRLAGTAAERQM